MSPEDGETLHVTHPRNGLDPLHRPAGRPGERVSEPGSFVGSDPLCGIAGGRVVGGVSMCRADGQRMPGMVRRVCF
jgi:hypothetical protein